MNAQLNTHTVREAAIAPFAQPILPAVLEHTACQVFESFSEKMKAALNGRQERALKLALEGHVTHKAERIFSVRSEDGEHSYLVDLDRSFCNCPDSLKGHICKHRLAAYLVEQSMKASQQTAASQPVEPAAAVSQPVPIVPAPPPTQEETIEKVRLTLHARSEYLRESIIYAMLPMDKDEMLPVEIIDLQGDVALVRALPYEMNGKPVPRFPFPDRKSFAQVIAKSLTEVKIYR
jgi:hypothetical protein